MFYFKILYRIIRYMFILKHFEDLCGHNAGRLQVPWPQPQGAPEPTAEWHRHRAAPCTEEGRHGAVEVFEGLAEAHGLDGALECIHFLIF